MTRPSLPRHRGRAPRVAALVYNDAANDARVLKEAATLRMAGATVEVFAVSRDREGRPAGHAIAGDRVAITRVQQFSLDAVAPGIARMRDRAQIRPSAPEMRGGASMPPRPVVEAPTTVQRVVRSLRSAASDLAMRAYKTVALADFSRRVVDPAVAFHPDVVHANDANTLVPALVISARTGAVIVYDSHELWLHRNVRSDRPLAPYVEALIERAGVRRAGAVITVSPSIVGWLAEHYGMTTPPFLVRNVPAAGEAPDPSRGRLHELAGLSPSDRIVAYGGRVTTSRGIEETIDALAALPPDVHLVMLGYGEEDYVDSLWKRAEAQGVRGRVHLVGPVASDEVADALSDADLAVVHVRPTNLSYRFALPNKLFESIRGGLPVAAADLPDIREVVESLGVGRLFDGEDTEDLARVIGEILEDPAPYREAARRAASELTWEHESERLISAYRLALMGERA